MSVDGRYGAAEQSLAFSVCYLAEVLVPRQDDVSMVVGVIEDVLPHVDRSLFAVPELSRAAAMIIDARAGGKHAPTYASAMMECQSAAAKFSMWRLGRAHDVFQSQQAKEVA
ncbi:MAG: hypothetical protein AAFU41_00720 [Pseudomonadota bacterium]